MTLNTDANGRWIDPRRVESSIQELSQYGAHGETGVARLVYSPEWIAAQDQVAGWMEESGLRVERDAVGNVWGYLDGRDRESGRSWPPAPTSTVKTPAAVSTARWASSPASSRWERYGSVTGSHGRRSESSRWSRRKRRDFRPRTSGDRGRSWVGLARTSQAAARLRRGHDGGGHA